MPLFAAALLLGAALAGCDGTHGIGVAAASTGASAESRRVATAGADGAVASGATAVTYARMKAASLGRNASLNGVLPFAADNPWNLDVSAAAVDPDSDRIIAALGPALALRADFGAATRNGAPRGIPYVVVSGDQAPVTIHLQAYPLESDPGPYPVPAGVAVEGERATGGEAAGRRRVLIVDRDHDRLYELRNAYPLSDGSWDADAAAVFHLDEAVARPTAQPGWTSADAAGLPVFPGLARYDEVAAGTIRHALRFTVARSRQAYVPPATHAGWSGSDPSLPPLGMRVRLKASYRIPPEFSPQVQVILRALQRYGMIVADQGSNWHLSGAPDARWDDGALASELSRVVGADFEVVRMSGLVTP